ncbi:MAG: hypothetical protein LBP59_20010 [Planctomycetaceae bacterium]|nr:hypothetical protein [Planctomycetaceae bacterium]
MSTTACRRDARDPGMRVFRLRSCRQFFYTQKIEVISYSFVSPPVPNNVYIWYDFTIRG